MTGFDADVLAEQFRDKALEIWTTAPVSGWQVRRVEPIMDPSEGTRKVLAQLLRPLEVHPLPHPLVPLLRDCWRTPSFLIPEVCVLRGIPEQPEEPR